MKWWIFVAIFVIVFGIRTGAQAESSDNFVARLFDTGTYVPVSDLARWLGAKLESKPTKYVYENGCKGVEEAATITLSRAGKTLKMGVGYLASPEIEVNGIIAQDNYVTSESIDGKIYLEVMVVAKVFGLKLQYDPQTMKITTLSSGKILRSEIWNTGIHNSIKSPTSMGTANGPMVKWWKIYSPDGVFVAQSYYNGNLDNDMCFGIFEQKTGWLVDEGGNTGEQVEAFAWHPDSRRYAVMHKDVSGGEDIILSPVDDGNGVGTTGAYRTKGNYDNIAFSADGKYLVFPKEKRNIEKDSTVK